MSQHFLLSAAARTISLKAVLSLTDADAWKLFQRLRWPDTDGAPVCPCCGNGRCYDVTRGATPRFRCAACRKDFSPTSGTLFAYHKLSIRDYLAAIVLFVNAVKGISALQLGRDMDISYKAAWVLCHKLREAMASEMKGASVGGSGETVEVDGCYVGGHVRPANYKANRKDRRLAQHQTGKRKVVVAIRERGGRTVAAVFPTEEASADFIKARVEKGTTVHTDEAHSWEPLRTKFRIRQINHSFAYSHDDACTNQAESFFSRLRRAEWGQYHQISDLYLGRYAAEMGWREDHRRQPNGVLFSRLVGQAGRSPMSIDFTGRWQKRAA
ncbi:transposase-like zinc ribbon protein [Nitrospirillum amazonense]|uniref:Transposase-like zinc ribbon protein n=1 Tax=Nitrospirillum amazonense TaxID=28077 RepID=A0A560FHV6_9PROT|nr:IS1595 family transposase [Nitrospirillum amazonense]TWB21175.1 transposase-like zinc ribbon protein [Nitrospirillum amazonense]